MLIVIDHLDTLKKDSAGAREAIRWLEAEFRKGSRLVQCSDEPHSLLLLTRE